uniref:Uncharacterized protein n=1 Tax=Sphaerodactylus townsendi TaxID=933632 RepID=A0ACB8EC43_9SAUR
MGTLAGLLTETSARYTGVGRRHTVGTLFSEAIFQMLLLMRRGRASGTPSRHQHHLDNSVVAQSPSQHAYACSLSLHDSPYSFTLLLSTG